MNGKKLTHVIMPHLDDTIITIEEVNGEIKEVSRWALIQRALNTLKAIIIDNETRRRQGINLHHLPHAFEDCVRTYNPSVECTFGILEDVLLKSSHDSTLLFIIYCASFLPQLFEEGPIDLLNGTTCFEAIRLSKDQICCILANAFLCTFPGREVNQTDYVDYPRINFTTLFDDSMNTGGTGWQTRFRQAKIEKTKCFLHYFSRMADIFGNSSRPSYISYERRSLRPSDLPKWSSCNQQFSKLNVYDKGVVEDTVGSLNVDFANKFVGGGVLGNGAAQEEIRFSCCPELVASQLFTKVLGPLETLLIHKFEQFSRHGGYGSSFRFRGNIVDGDVDYNHIVCMDAHHFPHDSESIQLQKKWIDRELNKCFVSFRNSKVLPEEDCDSISTGKWGCGVFHGDPLLKCLIQWMAASYFGKILDLYTCEDDDLSEDLLEVKKAVKISECSVGKLYTIILSYSKNCSEDVSLLQYIVEALVLRRRWGLRGTLLDGFLAGPRYLWWLMWNSFLGVVFIPRLAFRGAWKLCRGMGFSSLFATSCFVIGFFMRKSYS